ncbi:unnamed protein product [Bursaphelenchus xylophilus]|uniref:Large ribosomal subunit protein mL49 n=1 Tax=Bursaphelenchus xylophilus TaxID=6326 RepID=A0A1I7RT17_BURXY|nr:unnamed protein product [Bursaphelenchus xylophilus]CAG9122676.1 unnamed protein product [Bursaphelenchus xylophilus]
MSRILHTALPRLLLARFRPAILQSCYSASSTTSEEKPWEDPWKHAVPKKEETYTTFEEVPVDWRLVEQLLPPEVIPEPPNVQEITPSGWRPPRDPVPDLPYYIKRDRFHLPCLHLSRKRDQLNVKTMQHEYRELVTLRGVYGDVFACERDLKEFLENRLGHPVAIFANELQSRIVVCGADMTDVEAFVFEKGF